MIRQMQEQQQAYEVARKAKVASAPILQYSASYIPPQVYPQVPIQALSSQVMQAPAYFAGQPATATAHPTPHLQSQVRPVAAQVRPPPPSQMSQAMVEGASVLQAQLHAFLQQLNQPHNIPKVTPSTQPEGNTSQGAPF
jgi:peptidoglycan hydrolase-like amidase